MRTIAILNLVKRQAVLEAAMRRPGGIRIIEEMELRTLRERLTDFPEATRAILHTARTLRRPISEINAEDLEKWSSAERVT